MAAPTLRTKRLVLRPWRDEDLEPFAALNDDPDVMEYFPKRLTRAESDEFAARIRATLSASSFGLWAVEWPGETDFAGYVGLAIPTFEADFTPCVEIGWRLARSSWGKGVAPEAAMEVLRHGFGACGLREIVSFTSTENLRSQRVMEKIGMSRDASEDFDHPALPEGHRLQRHCLFRLHREGLSR